MSLSETLSIFVKTIKEGSLKIGLYKYIHFIVIKVKLNIFVKTIFKHISGMRKITLIHALFCQKSETVFFSKIPN
jgi:hypothetical protein